MDKLNQNMARSNLFSKVNNCEFWAFPHFVGLNALVKYIPVASIRVPWIMESQKLEALYVAVCFSLVLLFFFLPFTQSGFNFPCGHFSQPSRPLHITELGHWLQSTNETIKQYQSSKAVVSGYNRKWRIGGVCCFLTCLWPKSM